MRAEQRGGAGGFALFDHGAYGERLFGEERFEQRPPVQALDTRPANAAADVLSGLAGRGAACGTERTEYVREECPAVTFGAQFM